MEEVTEPKIGSMRWDTEQDVIENIEAFRKKIKENQKYNEIINLMFIELEHADHKYPDDRMSPDELEASFGTIFCEVMELKREIDRKKKRPDLMRKEAIQALAMCFKFMRDVILAEET